MHKISNTYTTTLKQPLSIYL